MICSDNVLVSTLKALTVERLQRGHVNYNALQGSLNDLINTLATVIARLPLVDLAMARAVCYAKTICESY